MKKMKTRVTHVWQPQNGAYNRVPDVKNYKWRLFRSGTGCFNYSCTHVAAVGLKGSLAKLVYKCLQGHAPAHLADYCRQTGDCHCRNEI